MSRWRGIIRKRIKRTVRIGGGLEEHAGKFVIRLERRDLQTQHRQQTAFQARLFLQRGKHCGQMLFMGAVIESLNQVLLRTEIMISIAQDTPAFCAIARMVVSSYPRSRSSPSALSRMSA